MRILLFGNTGQLGWELERCLALLGPLTALDYPQVNLAEPDALRSLIQRLQPQVIVNATGYTAVDRAETERDLAMAINAVGPGLLAEEARSLRALLVHYSTDYVFDGTKGVPYVETDSPAPLGVYGQSKLAGEQAIQQAGGAGLVLRTSWIYSLRRDSFVTKVLGWSRQQRSLRLVTDQISNPTWCRMLAEISAQVLALAGAQSDPYAWLAERAGLYHLAGSGYTSRFGWGQAILRLDPKRSEQVTEEILPALTADFPTQARRPLFSALNCDRFKAVFGLELPGWEQALKLAME